MLLNVQEEMQLGILTFLSARIYPLCMISCSGMLDILGQCSQVPCLSQVPFKVQGEMQLRGKNQILTFLSAGVSAISSMHTVMVSSMHTIYAYCYGFGDGKYYSTVEGFLVQGLQGSSVVPRKEADYLISSGISG